MLGIMAVMDKEDSMRFFLILVLLVTMHLALCSLPWFTSP